MLIYHSSSFDVRYDQEQGHLLLTCYSRLQSNEFREGLVSALTYAKESVAKRWLLNFQRIGCMSEEEETWLQCYLFPLIMSTLGTNNYMAVVLSEKCYEALLLEAGKYGLKSYNSFIIMNTFCNTADALAWLEKEKNAVVAG